jgi:hypothetical protein
MTVSYDGCNPRLAEHLRRIFEASPDGVYVWLPEGR